MASPGVDDHTAGGYFLVRSAKGSPPWMPPDLGVKRTVSASSQLVPIFPRPTWAHDFELVAERFGLAPHERAAAGQLADDLFNANRLGWPDVFFELADALAFHQRFASRRDDVMVIGIGLLSAHVEPFLAAAGRSGVAERLERREPLADGGTLLGYEILGMDVPPLESWAVNYLPALVREQLGSFVNDDGLIPSLEEARRVAAFVARPDVPSEPLNWIPWLLVEYHAHPGGTAGF